jgi:CDP-Glycerol:Poly(glycerophosphate) glycerophosphotransferase
MEEFQPDSWLTMEEQVLTHKVDGKTFADLTSYRGVALWWFIRFRFFNRVRTTSLIRTLSSNPLVFSVVDFVYDLGTSFVCRLVSGLVRQRTSGKGKTILITVHDRDWKTISSPNGQRRKGDAFFGSIIRELQRKGFKIVTVTPLKADFMSGLKTLVSRLKHQKANLIHREFNSYRSMKIWKKERDARRGFRKTWNEVLRNAELVSVLKKANLEDELPYYFDNIFGWVAKSIEMAKRLVEEEKPDFILVSSEHGIIQKSIMVAGKMTGIPTMALQHGTIGTVHKGYLSWKGSISESGDIHSPHCPIPDKTAVFGPYYVDLLTKTSDYPPNSVAATGQPRYDALVEASRTYDRGEFCRKLSLDPKKKLVLVMTENMPIPDGKVFLKAALRALKEFPEVQVVIKPHPAEEGEWYAEVVREEDAEATILPRNADTYEALFACDLFVGSYSTVILEGVILGRLGVTAFLSKGKDPTPYFREVTPRVYEEEELGPEIRKALYDDTVRERLRRTGAKFVFEHAYKMDGKATERVTNLIEMMMEKRV